MNTKTIETSDMQEGPIRHSKLSDGFVVRVKNYKQVLAEVETSSIEETLNDFQRDLNPENELRVWEKIASAYQWSVIANAGLTQMGKEDVFAVLLGLSTGSKDFNNIKNLSKEKIDAIVNYYS